MAAMITIANANALHIPLADRSVQCIVTSPPYWGLRDYGTAKWEGGSAACDHVQYRSLKRDTNGGLLPAGQGTRGTQLSTTSSVLPYRDICSKCGALRIDAQIGLESTPAAYVASIVAVMRECKRVLRDDGCLWLNLGDSFSDKQLMGIPWKVSFALQDDGWILRQDIIWSKPNPMPESVTDRCTKAHEYIFLLTKQARYYYDAEAIKEQDAGITGGRQRAALNGTFEYAENEYKSRDVGNGHDGLHKSEYTGTRNRRSVWTVATQPYSGAHFATFPPALIEPMILAGSRRGDTVLDPFAGSGTTGAVAVKHGRRAVLLDLNTKYIDLQFERTNGVQMMFETIAPNSPSNDVAR